jgi:hypothetical protein
MISLWITSSDVTMLGGNLLGGAGKGLLLSDCSSKERGWDGRTLGGKGGVRGTQPSKGTTAGAALVVVVFERASSLNSINADPNSASLLLINSSKPRAPRDGGQPILF